MSRSCVGVASRKSSIAETFGGKVPKLLPGIVFTLLHQFYEAHHWSTSYQARRVTASANHPHDALRLRNRRNPKPHPGYRDGPSAAQG